MDSIGNGVINFLPVKNVLPKFYNSYLLKIGLFKKILNAG
jgi:hypothetical protein